MYFIMENIYVFYYKIYIYLWHIETFYFVMTQLLWKCYVKIKQFKNLQHKFQINTLVQ